jgi:hypothetical protein
VVFLRCRNKPQARAWIQIILVVADYDVSVIGRYRYRARKNLTVGNDPQHNAENGERKAIGAWTVRFSGVDFISHADPSNAPSNGWADSNLAWLFFRSVECPQH